MNVITWTAIVASACVLTLSSPAQIGGSTKPPAGPRTGMIAGRVVDAGSGEAVGEAIVQLTLRGYSESAPDSPNSRVMADSDGRFFFSGLPPGEYYVQASKEGHAPGVYRQRRPYGPHQWVTLAADERRIDVDLPVWKYAVIGGTVVDEAGEPVVGVTVRALVKNVIAGRTRYGNMEVIGDLAPLATTDDRGMFRLARLMPGTYVVVVPSMQTTVPAAALENPDSALRTELFWGGISEITPLGAPRTMQMGEFALMTHNRVLIPPPPAATGRMQVYRTTYYPAASTAATSTPITVKSGEERTDVTIGLRPVPAVRVSGRLVTPDGSTPPPMMIRLVGDAMSDVTTFGSPNGPDDVGLETAVGLSDAQGRFMLLGVPPGEYVLQQANRFLMRPITQGKPSYWISHDVNVGREDIIGLTVDLRPALRVEGRLEVKSANQKESTFTPVGVGFETPTGEPPGRFFAEIARETMTFATVAAGGKYIVRPPEPRGWYMQSTTLNGKDITDRVFDLQGDATSLVVTYTDRSSKVSGSVTDAKGAPSSFAMVLAFPVDRERWTGYGSTPRHLKSIGTRPTGIYSFENLPPGDYYVVAIEAAEADGWEDPVRLEQLSEVAERLSLATSDSLKTLDLRVRTIR